MTAIEIGDYGRELYVMEPEKTYASLKQGAAGYLLFLLLTPMNLYVTETNAYGVQETTSSTPIGLVIGPGLAGGNVIAASSANKKLKMQLLDYNLKGVTIIKGETKTGLIGIKSTSFDALRLKVD